MDWAAVGLLLAVTASADVTGLVGARTEVRGGLITPVPGAPPQEAIDFELVPTVGAGLQGRQALIAFTYAPRLMRRIGGPIDRVLVLHSLTLRYNQTLTSRWRSEISGMFGRGEVDFIAAPGVIGPGTPGGGPTPGSPVPEAQVIAMMNVMGNATLTGQLNARETLTFSAGAFMVDLLSDMPEAAGVVAPRTFTVNGSAAFDHSFNPGRSLGVTVAAERVDFGDIGLFHNANARVRWAHRFNRIFSGGVALGALVALSETGTLVAPLADLSVGFTPIDTRALGINFTLMGGVDGFANQLVGTFETRVNASASLEISLGPDLTIGANGSFMSPLGEAPATGPGMGVPLIGAESVLRAALPIRYRVSQQVGLEGGGRLMVFGTRLAAEEFEFDGTTAVAYVALNVTYGLGPEQRPR